MNIFDETENYQLGHVYEQVFIIDTRTGKNMGYRIQVRVLTYPVNEL